MKEVNQRPAGELQPLPIPDGAFVTWTLDFVTDLPPVVRDHVEYNGILTCVDKYSKYTVLIPVAMGG